MSFFDHLDELRSRLVKSLVVFFGGFFLAWFLAAEWVMEFLRAPLFEILAPDQQKLYFTSLFENFLTTLKISGVTAIFVCSPYFFSQAWGFISPGLYEREKKFVFPFVVSATALFFGGAAFAYYVLFPTAFKFFVTFGVESDVALLTIESYYTTALKLLLLFGVAFELPLLVVTLGYFGIIDAKFLRENRSKSIIGITIACAMFAPPDAISMLLLMAPLILLYEVAVIVVDGLGARRAKNLAASGVVPDPDPPSPLDGRSR